jgi:hypothetical protein
MLGSESCITYSLDDILAALELRLETEEAIAKQPLTQALEQCLLFAQFNDLLELARFAQQELDGYRGQPPTNRYVQLSYFDNGGQLISGLSQYSSYPLATGVRKLELHLKNGLTLMLPTQILDFLSQVSGRTVDSGHVSPSEINKLLEQIRSDIVQKLLVLKK